MIQLVESILLTSTLGPWDLFRYFKVCSDAEERVGYGKQRKLPHLFIPSKPASLVTEFAVEDLPFERIATLVPAFAVKDLLLDITANLVAEFAVKDLPLGRTL